jgi:nitroreductase
MEAGRWAPSPLNLQPWEFIVITDGEIKKQIRQIAEEAKQDVLSNDGPKWVEKYNTGFLEEAPILVVVIVNPSRAGLGKYFGQKYGAVQAGSMCIQNMMLAAADLGLGTVLFTFFRPERLKTILNIPEALDVMGIVPIGRPKEPIKTTPPRKEVKIHRLRYNTVA